MWPAGPRASLSLWTLRTPAFPGIFLAYGVRTERAAEALQSETKHTHTPTHQTLQALASVHTFRLASPAPLPP